MLQTVAKKGNFIANVFFPGLLMITFGLNGFGQTVARMAEYLDGQSKYFGFNGNVLVAEKGKVVFQHSYGFANFDTKHLLNDSTVFELASVSKQFTATAILMLKDRGKLKLTDSLRQYFPELPYTGISLHQMLCHTSGLPDYEEGMVEKWDKTKIAFNRDMIDFLAKEKPPVLFAPGAQWLYSNTAFAILASIVEKVSGQSFSSFMMANVFKPLQMKSTRIYNTRRSLKDTITNYAYGFVFDKRQNKYAMPDSIPDLNYVYFLDGIFGDGVVNSTTADLLKWDRAVKSHTLLTKNTQEQMLADQSMADTLRKAHYGYGVFLEDNDLGRVISHSGGWPGYITFLSRIVEKDQTLIVLSNNASRSPAVAQGLQQILNGKPVELPYEHKAIAMDSVSLKKFEGAYKGKKSQLVIKTEGNKLFRVAGNGQKIELVPESAGKFFINDGSDRQVIFSINGNNMVENARLVEYGVTMEMVKAN
jgi:CubicO group peptidase (beta-lactamase class C family)